MSKKFHPTVYNGCNYLCMLGLKLNHVSKSGPRCTMARKETPIVFVLFGEGFVGKTESLIYTHFEDFLKKIDNEEIPR